MGDPSLRATLLEHMDVQQRVEQAARVVSDYLSGGEGPDGIMATLGHALLREDSDFHSFQIVDAGFKQYRARRRSGAGRHVLVGMTRFLAAHSPTYRAVDQTHNIALRLHRGEELYRDHLGIILRPLVTLSPPAGGRRAWGGGAQVTTQLL